ncbi:DSPc-domain-containing protein, partial [Backusella circina FSU 941]
MMNIPSYTSSSTPLSTNNRLLQGPLKKTMSSSLADRRKKKILSLDVIPEPSILNPRKTVTPYHDGPIRIMPYLYLGNEKTAMLINYNNNSSIFMMLNVAAEVEHPNSHEFSSLDDLLLNKVESTRIGYKKMAWTHAQTDLLMDLKQAIHYIDRAREEHKPILVHCQCGVARSAVVVIAYVIKTLGMSLQDAYDYVKERAPAINPNLGLMYQLR